MKTLFTKAILFVFCLSIFVSSQTVHAQACWSALGQGLGVNSTDYGVLAVQSYNGELYAVGVFDTLRRATSNIAKWNGTTWSPVGTGINLVNDPYFGVSINVKAMAVYNNELYVGGAFDTAGGTRVSSIAKWNGTTWSDVGGGLTGYSYNGGIDSSRPRINAMAVYNGELYVTGSFTGAGSISSKHIAKWNGSSWSPVAAGLQTGTPQSQAVGVSLGVWNNILFVGGNFNDASGVHLANIAAWDGNAFSAVGNGLGVDTVGRSAVTALAVYGGYLYGALSTSDGQGNPIYTLSKWTGSSWQSIVGGPGTGRDYAGYVFALLPFSGKLVAAGQFIVAGNDSSAGSIAAYDGSTWTSIGDANYGNFYSALAIHNGHLYAGGGFAQIGTVNALNIAEYTCAANGINDIASDIQVSVYPNPTNGRLTVSLSNVNGRSSIQVYDLIGQRVNGSSLSTDKTELDLSAQAPGTYLYRITTESGEAISSGSIVKQ